MQKNEPEIGDKYQKLARELKSGGCARNNTKKPRENLTTAAVTTVSIELDLFQKAALPRLCS